MSGDIRMPADDRVPACLTDSRDRTLVSQAPLIPMPFFGELPPPVVGSHQYVGAAQGIYVQAHHVGLLITARLTDVSLPYGELASAIHLRAGLIPFDVALEMAQAAVAASPLEWAGVVHYDERENHYHLMTPRILSRSAGEISYATDAIDPDRVVCMVHSHGAFPAFFSPTDDLSDTAGVYFACVLGHCQALNTITCCTRLVIEGHTLPLVRPPWLTRAEHEFGVQPDDPRLLHEFLPR